MCILDLINHDKNIFSRKLPFGLNLTLKSTYNDVYIQIYFLTALKKKKNNIKWRHLEFFFTSFAFQLFVATYFQINHERNINSAAFNIRIFLNHFAFCKYHFVCIKAERDMHAAKMSSSTLLTFQRNVQH